VFVTWECLSTKDVNVALSEGLLTVEGTAVAKWQIIWGAARGERARPHSTKAGERERAQRGANHSLYPHASTSRVAPESSYV
jgi:hypothetical protein